MLYNFTIVCTLCLSAASLASANNAFFIGARRHKPRWQGHPLTITGGYAPYQEDYHPDLSPYKYIYRPYYYQGGQSEDDISLEGYDYKDYPDKGFIPDYYTEDAAAALPLNDYQQALMRQNFIDFLIRQGPNMYKDHKKMKYMYRATNTYPKPIVESHDFNYDTNMFNQGTGINNYESYWRDKDESEERDHNNRTYVYGIPKYSESDEPRKTAKPNVFTTKDLRENNPFEANKEKNKVKAKDEDDVEVKELESQRNNLQDIISSYPLGAAGASVQEEVEDEYSPSSSGKSIKDLVSKDNMDENVQINDKPLWKQDDRSWISSLYKRAPAASSIPEDHSSNINNHNETPEVATTTERSNAVETEDSTESTEEDKTSSSSSSSSSEDDEKSSETKQSNKKEKKMKKIATKKKKKVKDNDDTVEVENTEDDNTEKKDKILKNKKRNKKEGNVNESKKRKKKKITDEVEDQTNNDADNTEEKEESLTNNLSDDETENSTKKTKKIKKGKKDTNVKKSKKKNSSKNKTEIENLKKLDGNMSLGSDSNIESDIEEIPTGNEKQDIAIVNIDDESDSLEENDMEINNDESDLNNSNDMSKEFPSALMTTFHQMQIVRPDMSVTNTVVAIISTSEFDEDKEESKQIEDNRELNNDPKPLLETNQTDETRTIEHKNMPLPLLSDEIIKNYLSVLKISLDLGFPCRQKINQLKTLAETNSKYESEYKEGLVIKNRLDKFRLTVKKRLKNYKLKGGSVLQNDSEKRMQAKFSKQFHALEKRVENLQVASDWAKENVFPENGGNKFPVHHEDPIHKEFNMDDVSTRYSNGNQ
uniref:Uncharacterized protein n=1 Tax=Cacopsylla melanoneura TaxID=428564 RepID=A0A8D9EAF6_9HEMI